LIKYRFPHNLYSPYGEVVAVSLPLIVAPENWLIYHWRAIMNEILTWIYLANATLIIVHEIDSAYWQEWNLMPFLKGAGAGGFMLIHIPLVALIIYGMIPVTSGSMAGLVISLLLAGGGIFAFFFHTWHIRRGNHEFTTPVSRVILLGTLLLSLPQVILTLVLMGG
jgi:hypothetical protein